MLVLHGKRPSYGHRLRLTAVHGSKLSTIGAGRHLDLLLHAQLLRPWLTQSLQFSPARGKVYPPAAATITNPVVGRDVGHVGDVSVVDDGVVYVRHPAVVIELIMVPISAIVATANVAVAIIHTAVVSDVTAPKSTMPSIAA